MKRPNCTLCVFASRSSERFWVKSWGEQNPPLDGHRTSRGGNAPHCPALPTCLIAGHDCHEEKSVSMHIHPLLRLATREGHGQRQHQWHLVGCGCSVHGELNYDAQISHLVKKKHWEPTRMGSATATLLFLSP